MVACFDSGGYRYNPNVRILWTQDIVDVDAPTEAEIEAATDLIMPPYCLVEMVGWEVDTEIIQIRSYGPFLRQLPASQSVDVSRLVFTADIGGNDIRTLLTKDDEGFVLFLPSGPLVDYPTSPLNVFPARVAQLTQMQRLWESSKVVVSFAVTAAVGENVLAVI